MYVRPGDLALTMPDQDAVIYFDAVAKRQTMIVESRFAGGGTDVAWLLPVPGGGDVEVFAATRGLFPTLRHTTAPSVARANNGLLPIAVVVVLAMCVLACVGKRARFSLLCVLGLLVCVAVLLPTLGKARSSATDLGVDVLSRATVGTLDTAVLRAKGSAELGAWLSAERFAVPVGPEFAAAIDGYIKQGWVFVASRLQAPLSSPPPGAAGGVAIRAPAPLGVVFSTDTAVYPLVLTGTVTSKLVVDLYVFADGRAQVTTEHGGDGFVCTASMDAIALSFGRPELVERFGKAPYITRLHATLDKAGMSRDASISIGEFSGYRSRAFTAQGARNQAALEAVVVTGTCLIAMLLILAALPDGPLRWRIVGIVLSVTLGTAHGVVWYTSADIVVMKSSPSSERQAFLHIAIEGMFTDQAQARLSSEAPETRADLARAMLASEIESIGKAMYDEPYDANRWSFEEDSPGNYTIVSNDSGSSVQITTYHGIWSTQSTQPLFGK